MEQERVGDSIVKIKINDVIIGDRARTEMGDIESMALSLQIEQQLLPIIVDIAAGGKYKLVEGERRIRAARQLGWTMIEAILLNTLTDVRRKELELIHCVQREQLTFMEEANAVKKLVEARKNAVLTGGIAKFGRTIRNKDVAMELNMTESRMSENLKIATALEEHPELCADTSSRTEFLRKVRNRDYFVPDGGHLQTTYKENFLVTTPMGCLDTINDKIIDLVILHPDKFNKELLTESYKRLKSTGQVILFCPHQDMRRWEDALQELKMNMGPQPYIWHIKGENDYQNYLWAGKNLLSPIRPMMNMIQAARPEGNLSGKSKPMQLMTNIIKCTTERSAFVVIPCCEDIESVRCCIELGRNVRAATSNKIMRDRLVLSVVKHD